MKRRVMMGKNVGMPDDNTVFLLNFDKEPIHDMLGKSVSKEGSVIILSNGRFKSCGQFGNGVLLLLSLIHISEPTRP